MNGLFMKTFIFIYEVYLTSRPPPHLQIWLIDIWLGNMFSKCTVFVGGKISYSEYLRTQHYCMDCWESCFHTETCTTCTMIYLGIVYMYTVTSAQRCPKDNTVTENYIKRHIWKILRIPVMICSNRSDLFLFENNNHASHHPIHQMDLWCNGTKSKCRKGHYLKNVCWFYLEYICTRRNNRGINHNK